MNRNRLVLFAKPPAAGEVKTRLAAGGELTSEQACLFHRVALTDLASRLEAGPWDLRVCCPAEAEPTAFAGVVPDLSLLWPEPALSPPPRDLGSVMADAISASLADGAERVVLIGADAPHLPTAWLELSFEFLAGCDLVLGPDFGGGCYLIGAAGPLPWLAASSPAGPVAWGQGRDYPEVFARAITAGLLVRHLPPTYDVDRPGDVRRLCQAVNCRRVPPGRLPQTVAWLGTLPGAVSCG